MGVTLEESSGPGPEMGKKYQSPTLVAVALIGAHEKRLNVGRRISRIGAGINHAEEYEGVVSPNIKGPPHCVLS
jgi:hypothetical protein